MLSYARCRVCQIYGSFMKNFENAPHLYCFSTEDVGMKFSEVTSRKFQTLSHVVFQAASYIKPMDETTIHSLC